MSADSKERSSGRAGLFGVLAAVFLLFCVAAFLLLPMRHSSHSRLGPCTNNLKLIGLALYNYHAVHKSFPPAFIADERGKPMHSWRVLLLPYFEEAGFQKIYEEYKFDEPWNGPKNSRLADRIGRVYGCPSDNQSQSNTSYVAIVGVQTAWPEGKAVRIRDFQDGTANTIMVIEAAGSNIHWMEPRDLTFAEATQGINPQGSGPRVASGHAGGVNCLFADGSVHFLLDTRSRQDMAGLFTIAGGERISLE